MMKNLLLKFRDIDTGQLSTVLLMAWILVIYGHSMAPADLSSKESGRILMMTVKLFSAAGVPAGWLTEHIIRKAAHFGEYFIFGCLLIFFVKSRPRRRYGQREWRPELVYPMILAMIFVPFFDETIQIFTPGRSPQIGDVWLDMAGGCLGAAAGMVPALLFGRRRPRRRRRRRRW